MPLLDDEYVKQMRAEEPKLCQNCKKNVRKNYCRQCDVFFYAGHKDDCVRLKDEDVFGDNHKGHRTY